MIAEVAGAAAIGVAAGALAGMFGVGGGVLFVPALTLLLGLGQVEAQATSLLAIVPVALLGAWRQSRGGLVRWRDALVVGGASVATAIAGALAATHAPERVLRLAFAGLLVVVAAQLLLRARAGPGPEDAGG